MTEHAEEDKMPNLAKYYIRVRLDDGSTWEGTTDTNLNRIAWLRLLPTTIELTDPANWWGKPHGRSWHALHDPFKDYKDYVNGFGRGYPIYHQHGSVEIVPQKITTLIHCEEVSLLEKAIEEEEREM